MTSKNDDEDGVLSPSPISEKGSEIDENGVVKSEDKMPDGANNLWEEWGSSNADGGASRVSSWARIK